MLETRIKIRKPLTWTVHGVTVDSYDHALKLLSELTKRFGVRDEIIAVDRRTSRGQVVESIPHAYDTVERRWRPEHEMRGRVVCDG